MNTHTERLLAESVPTLRLARQSIRELCDLIDQERAHVTVLAHVLAHHTVCLTYPYPRCPHPPSTLR